MAVKVVPEGYHALTPSLTVKDGAKAIDFYKKAFGAQERMRMPGPDGRLMHAELQIGDSVFMLGGEMPDMGCKEPASVGAVSSSLYVYVPDVDAAFKRAVEAGAKSLMPPADMFWGDRFGTVEDPSGHRWGLATHKKDPSPAEMEKGQKEFMASMAQKKS
jgi:PhnB protein